MAKNKEPDDLFVRDDKDEVYVRLEAVMNPFVAMVDGLSVSFFDGDTSMPYLTAEAAIDWLVKEYASTKDKERRIDLALRIAGIAVAQRNVASKLNQDTPIPFLTKE